MHVRIAWEIYYHQQKQTPEKPGAKLGGPDLLRPPPGPGVGTTAGAPIFPTLPRPPDLGPSILAGPGPSHRFDSPLLGHHLTPSVPGLGGMRYPGGAPPGPSAPPPSGFHHVGVTPTSIPGPPPGSMFSRESLPPGLTVPQPTPHDAWRLVTRLRSQFSEASAELLCYFAFFERGNIHGEFYGNILLTKMNIVKELPSNYLLNSYFY